MDFPITKVDKNTILMVAKSILSNKGGMNFSMREVARACGKSLSYIQYYYPSMDNLLSALFDDIIDDAEKKLDEISITDADELEWLIDLIVNNLTNVSLCRLVWETWTNCAGSSKSNVTLHNFYKKYIDKIKRIILMKIPDMDDAIADQKAVMIVSLFEGLAAIYTSGKNTYMNFDIKSSLYNATIGIINS